ncbi:MAG: TonB-dependent receptor plug domain-containing protein [Bacteroidales bacterium]|jgi:hypothetical protein|nr:TonB-dependent receptor plug domain-containing protein [Bacteroidales bacterium]
MKGFFSLFSVFFVFAAERVTAQESLPHNNADSVVRFIPEAPVSGLRPQRGTLQRIEIRSINRLPNPSGNIETMLKTFPGVSSGNELSAQYSVRGGSFDENLVYVNGVEIYRPVLIRSGQQEGLSFINPDMVASVDFSAGGFDAGYGDKMSSVLDVRYRIPSGFAVNTSASLLGASASMEGTAGGKRFSYLVGTRYKTSQYLLGTLDLQGDYAPDFLDVQGLFTFRITDRWDMDWLVNVSRNKYRFEPEIRTTNFGTLYDSYQLTVYYDGKEIDRYNNSMESLTLTCRPSDKWMLKFTGSTYQSNEQETFDIEASYRLSGLNTGASDSVSNAGVGSELSHARNYLNANNYSLVHTGAFYGKRRSVHWSVEFRQEMTDNRLNEWVMIDSAGYAVPYDGREIALNMSRRADNRLKVRRAVAWWQFRQTLAGKYVNWDIAAGIRFNYNDMNGEYLFSPRWSVTVRPRHSSRLSGHFAAGLYAQPPAYSELRDMQGRMNTSIKAQRSVHYTVGGDYLFHIGYRPFKLSSEIYYKQLSRLIPYRMENVRIYYAGANMASGYVAGWDVKLNGEFVKDAESWISFSLMHARQNIGGDAQGSFPFPTDRLANFNLFFQDYFPTSPTWRMFLNLSFGSPLPYHYPDPDRFDRTFRMPAYRRVDIGLSKEFFKTGKPHKFIRQFMINAEIFNLFDTKNTISYFWMQTVHDRDGRSQQFAIPNYLTARRINVKLSATF